MGKKLTPSGYQIIDIDCSDTEVGVALTLTEDMSDDVKTLYEIVKKGIKKPILLKLSNIFGSSEHEFIGFPSIERNGGHVFISIMADLSDGYYYGYLSYSSDTALWEICLTEI